MNKKNHARVANQARNSRNASNSARVSIPGADTSNAYIYGGLALALVTLGAVAYLYPDYKVAEGASSIADGASFSMAHSSGAKSLFTGGSRSQLMLKYEVAVVPLP